MDAETLENGENLEKIQFLEEKISNLLEVNASRSEEMTVITEGMRELNYSLQRQAGPAWLALYGGNEYEADGLYLDTIQEVSEQLRTHVTAGALMKRLAEIRGDYIYGEGIKITGTSKQFKAEVLEDTKWQEVLFSVKGLKEINSAHCTEGNLFFLVNTKTKKPVRVPISQITAHYANPDDGEDIWAVRREWSSGNPDDQDKTQERWYKTDMAPASFKQIKLAGKGGDLAPVDKDSIILIDRVNSQVGWTWGIPDLLTSLQWAEKYGAYLKSQARFAEALSAIAVQYRASSPAGLKTIDGIVRNPGVAGNATTGTDTEMIAQKGGSAVDFNNGRPMASQAASGAGVSVVTALSDPGASGSSYGAASALDDPTTRMVRSRRASFELFILRILKALGAPKAKVTWPQLSDDPLYRQAMSILAALGSGLFEGDELRGKLAAMLDIDLTASGVPEGYLLPNNSNSWQLSSIDPSATMQATIKGGKPAPSDQTTSGSNSLANGQGKDALGVGNTLGNSNDLRNMDAGKP